jgi:hypothetical protein
VNWRNEGYAPRARPVSALTRALVLAVALTAAGPSSGQETQLYWGDTHLHTSNSTDGYSGPGAIATANDAFRFARGIPVIHQTMRTRVRISRPLDFLVVADHADLMGMQIFLDREDPRLLESPIGQRLLALHRENPGAVFSMIRAETGPVTLDEMLALHTRIASDAWIENVDAAERNNRPGEFTAFAGWEWSSTPDGRNLHRVVFTPAPAATLRAFVPFSSYDSMDPEDLWSWLAQTAAAYGTDFIAIPHNSNMSTGLMFQDVDSAGRPMTADYARRRARWEPVVEMTQIKGTSEAHPVLSPNDEFADFELYSGLFTRAVTSTPDRGDFIRYALVLGLRLEADIGVNPYRFGLIGSTDQHVGLPTADEENFYGATARTLTPEERLSAGTRANFAPWNLSSSGLAGVWATANTRDAIAQAFQRREVYATSGPRVALRVFGSFDFATADAGAEDIAAVGYGRGVPMGGDLTEAPKDGAPTLLIEARKDPAGANLDRVQVVKGWIDAAGESHEQVYDAAWSGGNRLRPDGSLEPVGDTVDLETASYANTIGATRLATVWTDPSFDPDLPAVYYVRVLEIPTPRHQVYDAVALGMSAAEIEAIDKPSRIQERAFSSPIWYRP